MKKLAAAGLFLSLFSVGAFAASWTGVISDEHCGAKHAAMTADDKACVDKCAKGGAAAVLVAGDKVYKIDNQDAVQKHLGHKVTVTGTLKEDTVHVESVKM
jgi:hypothetical protein